MNFHSKFSPESAGVYELITKLCENTAAEYCVQSRVSQKALTAKLRSQAYEIILKRSPSEIPESSVDPVIDLLSHYFVSQQTAKNVAEYKRSIKLKELVNTIRCMDFGDKTEYVHQVLKLLNCLKNSVPQDLSTEMYQNPFSFGLLNEMLPKPKIEVFGSPEPYPYYPQYVFELPYSVKCSAFTPNYTSQCNTEVTIELFNSRGAHPENQSQSGTVKTLFSPMTLPSMTSTAFSPYCDSVMLNFPHLKNPRDIQISCSQSTETNAKVTLASTEMETKEVFHKPNTVDIWELASQVDKDIPEDIWDIVAKMPQTKERQLISTSIREVALWRKIYRSDLQDLSVISEKQFIRHIMYLIIGVETDSFKFNEESKSFNMKDNLVLEGISKEHLKSYVAPLLLVGTFYKRLSNFAFHHTAEDYFHSKGLVFEAAREVIRRYLLEFRLLATSIYEENCRSTEDLNTMPTLIQILYHIKPLQYEIETIASIYKVLDIDSTSIPFGAELMSYLFNEISLVTHKRTAQILYNSLFYICSVYFKFIERFIFEGEIDDNYGEFFIRKDASFVNSRSKRYWDKGFHITCGVAIPDFLRQLTSIILLCGKSFRLLKHCNPSDPLVLLISSDHPSVRCCASFDELEQQQQLLDVYRTRCLFVTGELVTFEQILLKREAERKAFTEMASLKQAETMEKIVAERKRLAQLIIAEKQHSLRVLEAAMAEAKAAKIKAKKREKKICELEKAVEKATEEVDSKLKDDERSKMMEYYSKLNVEVEKSKIHTEWKIKRLQLDQTRMQLLSTEERNLKREKLELEHQRNESVMAMSIQSDFKSEDDVDNLDNNNGDVEGNSKTTDSTPSIEVIEESECPDVSEQIKNKQKAQTSSDVFNAICNVAKSFFGVSKSKPENPCDNEIEVDAQGNVVTTETNPKDTGTSSNIIGAQLDNTFDNLQFLERNQEALKNKQKVLSHEFGQTDTENNRIRNPTLKQSSLDEENNIEEEWSPYVEAKKNRQKVLDVEFDIVTQDKIVTEPRTEAQKEALINKQKVLGVEYNIPALKVTTKEPVNIAQEEAIRNRSKVLGSEYEDRLNSTKKYDSARKSGLRLNLKPYSESSLNLQNLAVTPNPGAITPGEMYSTLDLETPTTAEIPLDCGMTSDVFTPRSEGGKDLESGKVKPDKEFLTSNGFNFSIIVDETAESEVINDVQNDISPENSPSKSVDSSDIPIFSKRTSIFNIIDGSYNLESFDPFGVKHLQNYSKDYFTNKLNDEDSFYTHPAIIMEEVKKRPYNNIFASHRDIEKDENICWENKATLTACLQRSVMLPLTYQLEVVNNSILTHFLVNLDLYEHLRSLKDYFFLMDGEFSRSICHNLFTKLTKTLNPQELLNFATLHNILDKALGSSISHVHKFSENLSFTITESPLSFQHSSPDVLQCLSLTYSVSWPLNIILSQEALLRYAKVFQFLVKMRRIFWVLSEDFESLKLTAKLSKHHSRKLLKSPQYISVQIYRHVIASLIRALDNYIVTTCILTSWMEFEKDLKKARTLDDLYECHVVYIKKVLFRCLLNKRSMPVNRILNDIFTMALKFSRVLKAGEWQQKEPNGFFTHTSFAQLQELYHLFEKIAKYLHKVITRLMEFGYQRHLVELLTMVNLNGYYDPEKSKEDTNTSVQST